MLKPAPTHIPNLAVTENTEMEKNRPLLDQNKLGRYIKRKRIWKRMPIAKFAAEAGVCGQTIQSIEKGARNASIIVADKIARALGLKLSELISSIEDPS